MSEPHLVERLFELPLFGLAVTIAVYAAAVALHARMGRPALAHPVLVGIAAVAGLLLASGLDYDRYFESAQPLHLLLGPFLVLLAVPLFRQFATIRQSLALVALVLATGCALGLAVNLTLAWTLAAEPQVALSLLPRSITTAAAVGVSEASGGLVGLTAAVVILTGVVGAVAGPPLLAVLRVRDERAQGFALGVAAHAIGTARAFQISTLAGTFAGIGMILNALLTVALAPLAIAWFL